MARINFGSTKIPVEEYYEIRRLDSDLMGRTWWNTVKTAKTKKKAIETAKRYEVGGRHVQVRKVIF